METETSSSNSQLCSLCCADLDLCLSADSYSLPDYLQLFLLRSVLQLSYKDVASVLGGNGVVQLCGGCRSLIQEAFDLEEEATTIQTQLRKLIDRVKVNIKGNGILGLGVQEVKSEPPQPQPRKDPDPDALVSRTETLKSMAEAENSEIPESSEIEFEEHIVKLEPDTDQQAFVYENSECMFPFLAETETTPSFIYQHQFPPEMTLTSQPTQVPSPVSIVPRAVPSRRPRPATTSLENSSSPKKTRKLPNAYYCQFQQCRKFFTKQSSLQTHERVRHGGAVDRTAKNLEFKCPSKGCGMVFGEERDLVDHEKNCEFKPYACNWLGCGKRYRTTKLLNGHISSTHKREGVKYTCRVPGCTQGFREMNRLKIHQARCQFKYDNMKEIEKKPRVIDEFITID